MPFLAFLYQVASVQGGIITKSDKKSWERSYGATFFLKRKGKNFNRCYGYRSRRISFYKKKKWRVYGKYVGGPKKEI